jgi:hypothetical protein
MGMTPLGTGIVERGDNMGRGGDVEIVAFIDDGYRVN